MVGARSAADSDFSEANLILLNFYAARRFFPPLFCRPKSGKEALF
jgi:hypothetical protein